MNHNSAVLDDPITYSAKVRQFQNRLELLQSGLLPHNAVVAEIGVNEGGFAKLIAEYSQPRELHLVDVFLGIGARGALSRTDAMGFDLLRKVSQLFEPGIKAGRVVLYQGLSVTVLRAFSSGYFDWLYVDGDHSYEGVLADLFAAEPKIKPGGFIAGHDFATEELRPMLTHVFPGVIRAVHEFCQSRGWEIVALTTAAPPDEGSLDPSGNIPSYVLAKR